MTRFISADTAQTMRRILLGIAAFGIAGTTVDLLLIGHYQEWTQWPPLVLLGLTALGIVLVATRPTPRTLQLFRLLMVLVVSSSLLGVYFHLHGNMEFRAETNPDLAGFALLWKSLKGGMPLLAPGVMAQVGLLGLAATFRHPGFKEQPESKSTAKAS